MMTTATRDRRRFGLVGVGWLGGVRGLALEPPISAHALSGSEVLWIFDAT